MRTSPFSGTVDTYQGQPVSPVIAYSGEAEQYENLTEAKQSEDWPGDNEILKWINTRSLTAAKAKKYQEVTKTLKENYEKSPAYLRKQFVDAALLAGMQPDAANALADSMPNLRVS